jgi:hypothetical protein
MGHHRGGEERERDRGEEQGELAEVIYIVILKSDKKRKIMGKSLKPLYGNSEVEKSRPRGVVIFCTSHTMAHCFFSLAK